MAGLAARFFEQAHAFDAHRAIDRLAHVVDRQQARRGRGQRLHLDAGASERFGRHLDRHGAASSSKPNSTATRVSGNGCASGIRSAVRFAAWIAAMRATPSTSPFVGRARADQRQRRRAASRCARRRARHACVTSLPPTSTMCACPAASKWVKCASRVAAAGRRAREPRRTSAIGIGLRERVPSGRRRRVELAASGGILAPTRSAPFSRAPTLRAPLCPRMPRRRRRRAAIAACARAGRACRRRRFAARRIAPAADRAHARCPTSAMRRRSTSRRRRSASSARRSSARSARSGGYMNDPEVNDYLNELGHRLVAASQGRQAGLRVLRGARSGDQRVRAARRLHRRAHRTHPAHADRIRARERCSRTKSRTSRSTTSRA